MKISFMDIGDFKQCFPCGRETAGITERTAFSCNKWSALNLIIFFATKSMGASATGGKSQCVFQLESLTFSEACLCFSIEINGLKGHVVKMFEYNILVPRQRQIPFLFEVINLLYLECQKFKNENYLEFAI